VITSLGSELLGASLDRIWTRGLTGEGAWEYFLRGVSHFYKYTKRDNASARGMFEKIYQLHPEKVIGPAYLALTHWVDATRGWSNSLAASMRQAGELAEKSIEPEEENNGLGHVILGSIRLREGRHEEGLALCRKGVAFRANCPFALGQLAVVQNYCGDARGAVKTAREALTVRMLYPPPIVNVLAMAYRDSGEIGLSIPAAREATRLDPEHTDAFVTLCSDYALAGDVDEARRVADRIVGMDPEFRISAYVKKHPYKDATIIAHIAEAIQSAGLPK
jgi:adenylate cyclase